MSSELAKELELKILGSKEGQSAGGKVAVSLARVGSIAIVEIKLEYVDLGHIAKTIGAKIDGDLGYNFLRHFGITINYRDYEICLDDPQRIEDFGNASKAEVPIRLANPAKPLILVDVHANGRGPFQFAVDTGISTFAVTPELAKQLGVTGSPIGHGQNRRRTHRGCRWSAAVIHGLRR